MHSTTRSAKVLGFTLLESLISILAASLLVGVLVSGFVSFKIAYDRVLTMTILLDDGYHAYHFLIDHIHRAIAFDRVIPFHEIPPHIKTMLKSDSDVLILRENIGLVAYYVSKASYKRQGSPVLSLFEKPLEGQRMELVPDITAFHVVRQYQGLSFELTARSQRPVRRVTATLTDPYVSNHWYGFAVVNSSSVGGAS